MTDDQSNEPDPRTYAGDSNECPNCHADGFPTGQAPWYQCGHCRHTYSARPVDWSDLMWAAFQADTDDADNDDDDEPAAPAPAPADELVVDRELRNAYSSLRAAERLATTAHGEVSARVMGHQFDAAFAAIETLIELRAGNNSRTAALFGVAGPKVPAK